jgi:hypothetical protein
MASYTGDLFPPEFNANLFAPHHEDTLALAKQIHEGLLAGDGQYACEYFWPHPAPNAPETETEENQRRLRGQATAKQRVMLVANELRARGFYVQICHRYTSIEMQIN